LSALQHAAQSALVIHPNRLIEHGAAWLTRRDVLGLLVMQCDAEDVDLIPTLLDAQSAGVQVVAYGSDRDARPWDRVVSDHAAGAAKLTRWLIEQGRRRVLRFWRFPEPRPWRLERDRGHELAMRELGMDPLPAVVTASPANSDRDALYQDEEYEGLIAMIMGYLYPYLRGGREPIDAIMTATDRHALEVGEAVTRLGLRPGIDVAIVGYDHSYPYLMDGYPGAIPPAATADKNNDRIGRAMCDLLLARLRNELPADPQVVAVDPSLIVGHPADASISQDSTPFSS
jgi:DNA-binding LacI/PurR family transcriptional regulator